MNPLTYSLCQKPVIGLMMFASGLCVFPPVFQDEPLPLQQSGASFIKEFKVPVSKPYFLEIGFEFPSAASIRSDDVAESAMMQIANAIMRKFPRHREPDWGGRFPFMCWCAKNSAVM